MAAKRNTVIADTQTILMPDRQIPHAQCMTYPAFRAVLRRRGGVVRMTLVHQGYWNDQTVRVAGVRAEDEEAVLKFIENLGDVEAGAACAALAELGAAIDQYLRRFDDEDDHDGPSNNPIYDDIFMLTAKNLPRVAAP